MYSALVVDHFERPRNSGYFATAADVITGSAGSRAAGTLFTLSARVSGDSIVATRCVTFGCPHCIAAASWLSERLIGIRRDAAVNWRSRQVAEVLSVPVEKRGRLLILEDAVHALAENWRQTVQNPPAGG